MSLVFTIESDIMELKEGWNKLIDRIASPEVFYRFEWIECYLKYYNPMLLDRLCVVVGRDKEVIKCIFPFTLYDNTVNFITSESTDYNSFYVDDVENVYYVTSKAIEFLLNKVKIDKFCLTNMPSKRELFILQDVLRKLGYSAFLEESVMCPYICQGHEYKFIKKQIKDIERRERRLLETHEIRYESKNELTRETLEFIAENRNKRYTESTLKKENVKKFYYELAGKLGEYSVVNELYLDGKLVAAHMGYKNSEKLYYYVPTYLEEYSSAAVGMILLMHTLKENENVIFDFLKGNEEYKFYWCDDSVMNFHLLAYKKGKDGFLPTLMTRLKNNKNIRKIFGR